MLQKTKDLIPVFAVITLVLSITKQYIFYSNFDIPIKYFISLSELGILISNDLMISVPTFGIYVLAVFHSNLGLAVDSQLALLPQRKKIVILSIVIATTLFMMFIAKEHYTKLTILGCFSIIFLINLAIYFPVTYNKILPNKSDKIALFMILLITTAIILKTGGEIASVEHGKYIGTVISTTDNKSYLSTDTSYFVGKTEKYIFFYRTKIKGTQIIPVESVRDFLLVCK